MSLCNPTHVQYTHINDDKIHLQLFYVKIVWTSSIFILLFYLKLFYSSNKYISDMCYIFFLPHRCRRKKKGWGCYVSDQGLK